MQACSVKEDLSGRRRLCPERKMRMSCRLFTKNWNGPLEYINRFQEDIYCTRLSNGFAGLEPSNLIETPYTVQTLVKHYGELPANAVPTEVSHLRIQKKIAFWLNLLKVFGRFPIFLIIEMFINILVSLFCPYLAN